jgi:leader peptidase (prepilin peptidase)/N-methyltransferase
VTAAVLVLSGLFGLAIGSFLNVVAYRLPRRESLSNPPSRCPSCGMPLAWRDNVPVMSWVLLRGRCRSCAAPISVRYPLIEAATAVLFVVAAAIII